VRHTLKNLVLFKLGWLACVGFAATGKPLLATAAVAVVALLHLVSVPNVVKEALLLMTAALIGLAWESFLVATGLLVYPGYEGAGFIAPYWIVAMWVLFATTINYGLKWVKKGWPIAIAAGLIGGPLAFYGGASMGAVEFSHTLTALAVIGAGWAVLLPLLVLISDTIIDSPWLEPGSKPVHAAPEFAPLPIFERRLNSDR
jgi:hypothetical protein